MNALENALEDAAKAAFVQAQSVYRGAHDHFPLKYTWETTTESIREGWRRIAYAAVEAARMPPLGTQPEPRQPRTLTLGEPLTSRLRAVNRESAPYANEVVHALCHEAASEIEGLPNWLDPEIGFPNDDLLRRIHADIELRGRKDSAFAVSVHHRNIVLSAVANALRSAV